MSKFQQREPLRWRGRAPGETGGSRPGARPGHGGVAARVAVALGALSLLLLATVVSPVHAQTNSPGGSQQGPASPGPSAGGVSNQSGANAGGDTQSGNQSTPGNGGATGGGAGAPGKTSTGGGSSKAALGIVGVLVLLGIAVFVTARQRRLQRVGAS
jgi:uncharacterized membrane protein